MNQPLIFICSPYRGDVKTNTQNACRYCRFVLQQNGIPFAPHLLFTQFLNDSIAEERETGIALGLEMLKRCDELWAFGPPTEGMALEIQEAARLGVPVRRFDTSRREVTDEE